MDARFTAGRLTHREARLCHQVMPPGGPDTPSVTPPLPRGPDVMRPPMGPPGPMMSARVGGAADAQQQLLASNFLRESQDFMARFNDIQRRFAGRPDLMQVEMQQAIQGANRELLMRHQQSGGNYPMFVIQPTAQGLVAFMQTPRGPMPIPLGGPPMPPGMSVGGAVPGMPGVPGSMPGMPPGMMMTPGGMMRPSMIPGRPGMMEYPAQPVGPDTIAFVRGLYLSRNPERMTPQMRTLWQQTIIGGLELLGFVSPSSLEAVIGVPPREPLTISGSRMQPLFRVIGAVRLIGVAIAFDRLRSGRTGPGDIPPVDVNAAIDAVNRDPNRLVNLGIARGPDNRITSVNITPRPQTELPPGRTALTTAQVAERLRAQGLTDAQFRIEGGSIVLTNPTAETMQSLMRAMQSMTTAEIVPAATSEARINAYKDNLRRKVDVVRTPPTGALTGYELTPRAGIADPVTLANIQKTLVDGGMPVAVLRVEGTKLIVSGVGINAANLVILSTALESLMLPATPDSRMDDYGRNANRKVNVARLPATGPTTSFELTPRTDGIPEIERLGTEAISKALRDAGVPAAGMVVDGAVKVTVSGVAITPENLAKVATALEGLVTGAVTPESPATARLNRGRRSSELGANFLQRGFGATWNVDHYDVPLDGRTLQVKFDTGVWKFKNAAGAWKNVAGNTIVAADLLPAGAAEAVATRFNNEVLGRLRQLDGGDATATAAVERLQKSNELGEQFLEHGFGATWNVDHYEVPLDGRTLQVKFDAGVWKFKNAAGEWKSVTGNTVVAADLLPAGAAEAVAARFNNEVLGRLRQLDGGDATATAAVERLNRTRDLGQEFLEISFSARWNVDHYDVPLDGSTLEMKFDTGVWKFKNAAGAWKNVTGNTVVAADLAPAGAPDAVAARFNNEVLGRLRQLDGGDATAIAAVERLKKSNELGRDFLRNGFNARWVAADSNYEVPLDGRTLKMKFDTGAWKFKNAAGEWKNVTGNTVVAADLAPAGAPDAVAARFNDEVLTELRAFNTPS